MPTVGKRHLCEPPFHYGENVLFGSEEVAVGADGDAHLERADDVPPIERSQAADGTSSDAISGSATAGQSLDDHREALALDNPGGQVDGQEPSDVVAST